MNVTTEGLIRDVNKVFGDAEDLLKATANQTEEQVTRIRARADRGLQCIARFAPRARLGASRRRREVPFEQIRHARTITAVGAPWRVALARYGSAVASLPCNDFASPARSSASSACASFGRASLAPATAFRGSSVRPSP